MEQTSFKSRKKRLDKKDKGEHNVNTQIYPKIHKKKRNIGQHSGHMDACQPARRAHKQGCSNPSVFLGSRAVFVRPERDLRDLEEQEDEVYLCHTMALSRTTC
ncbi:hypothetical protein MN608_10600 [Microdochium nivale]|nr:hypothetical protein MN608_10600 [Microdochium nivale]